MPKRNCLIAFALALAVIGCPPPPAPPDPAHVEAEDVAPVHSVTLRDAVEAADTAVQAGRLARDVWRLLGDD